MQALILHIVLNWKAYTHAAAGERKLLYVADKMYQKGLVQRIYGAWRYIATGVSKETLLQAGLVINCVWLLLPGG